MLILFNYQAFFQITVFDFDDDGKHDMIGSTRLSLEEMRHMFIDGESSQLLRGIHATQISLHFYWELIKLLSFFMKNKT